MIPTYGNVLVRNEENQVKVAGIVFWAYMDLWALAKRSAALFVRERKGNAFDDPRERDYD